MTENWFDALPDDAYLRESQIVGTLVPVSSSTWWRMVKNGKAPAAIKLSTGTTVWRVGDLRKWLKELG